MTLKAQQVFRSLDPYRAVSDLKLPLKNEKGLFVTNHPKSPDHRLQIAKNEFVAMDYTCPTPACNVFDFLALHIGSYESAIDFAIDSYHNLAQLPIGVTMDSIRHAMIDSLKEEREQFEEILKLREPFRNRDVSLVGAYIYCRRHNLSVDHAWRMIYVAKGSKLNQILHYSPTHVERFQPETPYIVYPYFKNRHTFAMLQIRDVHGKHVKSIELNPCRSMFFGLHSCLPSSEQVQVYEKPEDAMVLHSYCTQQARFKEGFVNIAFDPSADPEESPLKSGIFMATADTDFNLLVKNRGAFEDFYIADYKHRFAETLDFKPWHVYALNTIVGMLNKDRSVSPRVSMFVESLKSDPKVCSQLLYYMEECGQFVLLDQIKRHVDTHQVFTIGSMQVSEKESGYVAKKVGTNASSHFTNFLIKIDVTIWFEETAETFYSGRIVLNGHQVPFLISSLESKQAKQIVQRAEQAVQKAGVISEVNLPIVLDTTLVGRLVDIIGQQTQNKPRRVGIQRLGWSTVKNRFITPGWEARQMGVSKTSKIIHPGSELVAKYFTVDDYPIISATDLVTPQARYLMALVVASMTRAFLNQHTPTTLLIRSPHSLALLGAVFRPFGQVVPIELNPNRRLVLETLSARHFDGYPLYATCPDLSAVENFNYPLFILTESGTPLHEPITPEAATQITSMAHRIFGALAVEFVKDRMNAHGLIDCDQSPGISELALEGKRIIEARCGFPSFDLFEPELPIFQAVLSHIPSDRCNDFFRWDLEEEAVFIRCRLINHITTRQPLFDELLAKNPDIKLHSDHYISCPADWFKDLLSKFYGRAIPLYHQAPDSPSATEAQDGSQSSTIC